MNDKDMQEEKKTEADCKETKFNVHRIVACKGKPQTQSKHGCRQRHHDNDSGGGKKG